jgi:hypothetical protein
VQKEGSFATLELTGQTAAGVTVTATITCNTVLEVNGAPKRLSQLSELKFAPDSALPTGSLSLTLAGKSYQVQTGKEVTCDRNFFGQEGLFGYEYYLDDARYNSLDLFIPDLEAAKNGTSDFGFAIDTDYLIYRTGEGQGTVTASKSGDTLTLKVDAISPDGIAVQATLVCLLE